MSTRPSSWLRRLSRADAFDLATGALIAALLLIAVLTVGQYGISNDEEVQHRYGELIIAYYASGFADRTVFHFKNLYLYGGLFDIVAVALARLLPFDLFLIRHLLTAACGIAGIAATAVTARLIAGPRAGFLAAAALAVCGVWFGGMFNHTKDIPFAAAMIGAVYLLLRLARDLPQPRTRDLVGFGLLLGASLGLRAMGLLLFGYAALVIAAYAPWRGRPLRQSLAHAGTSLLRMMPAFALAYVIMGASWPWSLLDPLNPVRAIFSFAHFHYPISTIAAGQIYEMADVPYWYVPLYIGIKLPIALFAGSALAFAPARKAGLREPLLIAVFAMFPVSCEVIASGPAFTGMRHFLFVVPPLAVLTGIGFDAVLSAAAKRRLALRSAAAVAVGLALLWPASVLIRLHPYEYLFYNQFVGGLPGAARLYAMDYWVNIMPEAVRVLERHLGPDDSRDRRTYSVAVCGEAFSFEHYADHRLKATGWWKQADFFIAPTHMNCDQALGGRVIATIRRLGVPIGVVKDRRVMLALPGTPAN